MRTKIVLLIMITSFFIHAQEEVDIAGFIDSISDSTIAINLNSILIVPGTEIVHDNGDPLDLSDLLISDYIEVVGFSTGSGTLNANEITLYTEGIDVFIGGAIQAIASETLNIVVDNLDIITDMDTRVTDEEGNDYGLEDLSVGDSVIVEAQMEARFVLVAEEITLMRLTGIPPGDHPGGLPAQVELFQNYPNPFNPTTNFGFRISDFGFVSLKVYDVQGRLVKTLIEQDAAPGRYEASWDATSNAGQQVAAGVYFYRMSAGDFTATKKMLLIQ